MTSLLPHLLISHALQPTPHAHAHLPTTLSLLELHAPFAPANLATVDDDVPLAFLKALDALVLSKDHIARLVGWSVAAVVVEQGREHVLEAWGRPWVVGLMGLVGHQPLYRTRISTLTAKLPNPSFTSILQKPLATELVSPLLSLLSTIFLSSPSLPSFNREVAIPWLQRFASGLFDWAEKGAHLSLVLPLLPTLIAFHPPTFRPHLPRLLPLSLRHLSDPSLAGSSAHLYATLHLPTGKGSSPAAYVADLRAALGSATECLDQIANKVWEEEGSFGKDATEGAGGIKFKEWEGKEGDLRREKDGLKRIERSFGRLKGLVGVVCRMLRQPSPRPVPIPIGLVLAVALRIFRLTADGPTLDHANPQEIELAKSLLPELYLLACGIVGQLTLCVKQSLLPHLTSIQSYLIYLLERTSALPVLHFALLKTLHLLTTHIPPSPAPSSGSLLSRATKATLTNLTPLLPNVHQSAHALSSSANGSSTSKGKGKKRSHADVTSSSSLSLEAGSSPLTTLQAQIILVSLRVLNQLLPQPALPPSIRTLATRILLNLSLTLKSSKKGDRKLLLQIEQEVEGVLCENLAKGGSAGEGEGTMGGEASWVISGLRPGSMNHQTLSSLLHPLLPALPRPLPSATSFLFYKSEGKDERAAREDVGLDTEASLSEEAMPSGSTITTTTTTMDVETPAIAPVGGASKTNGGLFDTLSNHNLNSGVTVPSGPAVVASGLPALGLPISTTTNTTMDITSEATILPPSLSHPSDPTFVPTTTSLAAPTIPLASSLSPTTEIIPPLAPARSVVAPLKDLWAEERKKQVEEDSDGEIPEIDMGGSSEEDDEESDEDDE